MFCWQFKLVLRYCYNNYYKTDSYINESDVNYSRKVKCTSAAIKFNIFLIVMKRLLLQLILIGNY